MKRRHVLVTAVIAALGLALSACGSSPTSPSETSAGVVLHGATVGQSSASTSSGGEVGAMAVPGGRVSVTVQENPSITTTISANGTFELRGLPADSFTLGFTSNSTALGTIRITSVPSRADVSLVVQITTTSVSLVRVEINGSDAAKTCLINGGREGEGIELEGSISKVTSPTTFEMSVNGNRASDFVTVDATGATFTCAGVKGTCDATLIQKDARVHVRGPLTSCTLAAALVTATEVKFQH